MSDPIGRRRMRVTGVVQGVGFRPFVHALAAELGLTGFVGNDADGVFLEAQGPALALAELERRIRDEPPPLAVVDEVPRRGAGRPLEGDGAGEPVPRRRGGGLGRSRRARLPHRRQRHRPGRHVDPPGHGCVRRTAWPRCETPPTVGTATRSSPAPTAAPATRSPRAFPTTARTPPWSASRCAHRAWPSTRTRPAGGSTPSRPPARNVGRGCRCPSTRWSQRCGRGGSWRSRASAATTWRVTPAMRRRCGRCAPASSVAPSPSPSWPPTWHTARQVVVIDGTAEALLTSPARPIVILPALDADLLRRRGARHRDPRGDAPLRPPAPPAVRRRRPRPPGDDQREPRRRADLHRPRRGRAAPGRPRGRVRPPRPAHPRRLRRLRHPGGGRIAAAGAPQPGLRADAAGPARGRPADAGRGWRAEEHRVRRPREHRVAQPAHRRHRQPRDPGDAGAHGGDAVRAAAGHPRGDRVRRAPRLPVPALGR